MAPTSELDLTSLFNQRRSTEVAETSRATATKLRKKYQVGSVLVTMDDIYTNPRASGSYGGIDMMRRYSHKPRKQVAKYLSTLDAYTLHKPTRVRFPRRRTVSKGIADLF